MLKLLTADKIRAQIALVGKRGKVFAELVHNTAMQTLLHAEKHGDVTLADSLVKTLKETTPGYVWQGLVLWFTKNSPIRWDADGKCHQLKKDDKGYKPYAPEAAEAAPAAEQREVQNRTNTRIEPFSIALVKKRVASMLDQLDKATKADGRGVTGDPETIRIFLKGTIAYMDKVAVIEERVLPANGEDKAEGEKEEGRKAA